jgi:hypothetical protein
VTNNVSSPSSKKPTARQSGMAKNEELGDLQIRFQEAHGACLFRQGKLRALFEVKSPSVSAAIYEARLRGYDRASSAYFNAQNRSSGLSVL